jgi:hypothetical protein
MHPPAPAAAAVAHHAGGHGPETIALAAVVGALYGACYAISIRLHPWKPCRRCGESGKHRGTVFTDSFRGCTRCGGTGRELRRFAHRP